jgi:site-specific DNA recombinase
MASKGMWLGGGVPYGFTNDAGKLVVNADEAKVVRLMFELFVSERSHAAVRHRLRTLGIKNRQGCDWNATSITYILRNRAYLGELVHAKCWYRGPQEALVDSDVFEAVQANLPVKRRARSKMERAYPLIDVLHCGHCGTRLSSHYVDRGKRKVPYYRCTQTFKRTWKACPHKQVNADKIECIFMEILESLSASPMLVAEAVERANHSSEDVASPLRERERVLREQQRALSLEINNLLGVLKAEGVGSLTLVREELERLNREKTQLDHDVRETRLKLTELGRTRIDTSRAETVIRDFRLLYELARPEERRELVRLVVKRITFRGRDEPLEVEFFDCPSVTPPAASSKLSTGWLRRQDSNLGPGG